MKEYNKDKQNRLWLNYQLRTFGFAFNGLHKFFRSETKASIHTIAALLAVITGLVLKISLFQWGLITLVIGLVFISELINSSIEKLVDMISPEKNQQAGLIKDMAAGAVLFASLIAIITGLLVFVPASIDWLHRQ